MSSLCFFYNTYFFVHCHTRNFRLIIYYQNVVCACTRKCVSMFHQNRIKKSKDNVIYLYGHNTVARSVKLPIICFDAKFCAVRPRRRFAQSKLSYNIMYACEELVSKHLECPVPPGRDRKTLTEEIPPNPTRLMALPCPLLGREVDSVGFVDFSVVERDNLASAESIVSLLFSSFSSSGPLSASPSDSTSDTGSLSPPLGI